MSIDIAHAIKDMIGAPIGLRVGIVTSVVSGSQLTATVAGTPLTLPYLSSYVPATGDAVIILYANATWIALGTVG